MTPRSTTRTALLALGLVLAGLAFAAALAVLTTKIASPQIGLRGTPGVLTPADVATTPASDVPARTTSTTATTRTRTTRTATDGEGGPSPASTPRPTATARPPVVPAVPDDDATVDDDGGGDDGGRGRGRGRGRGGDDADDD